MPRLNKRSITIARHRTSVSLEPEFWQALTELAGTKGVSVATLIGEIDQGRGGTSLSAAIRLYVLAEMRPPKI